MSMNNKSVLIIGATGALGTQCLRALADQSADIHVFCRNPSKLNPADEALCKSVIVGNARDAKDVEKAMMESNADFILLATGNGADTGKSDTREKTGKALADAMAQPGLEKVKAIVVSSVGASETKIIVGFGIGAMVAFHLKHVLADHTHQEAAFATLEDRTLIVRPTSLTDDKGGKKIVEFDGTKKGPSIEIDRSDVAAWITKEMAQSTFVGGRKVCLTNA